jgi:hypothetical protein
MKGLSVLAISTACSISLGFLAKAQPASAALESENNNSFATRQFLPSGTSTVEGELSPGKVDYYTFPSLDAGKLFDARVNSNTVDPVLGLVDGSGKPQLINDDRSDFSVLSQLTGTVPTSGSLTFGVSGLRDLNLAGEHFESGPYTLSLNTFALPKPSTNATLVNGNFESGNLTGWTTLGENSIETSAFRSSPTQGTYQALLSTEGASFADPILEEFLGLEAGSIDSLVPLPPIRQDTPTIVPPQQPGQSSAIQQTFTAKAGDILSFDWNFLTNEFPNPLRSSLPDFSFVSISSPSNSINCLAELAYVFAGTPPGQTCANTIPTIDLRTSTTQFFQETGFQTFSYTIPTTGTYTLGIGVTNKFDNFNDSGLLIDNVRLTSVPDPSTVLSLLGLGGLGCLSVLKRFVLQKLS